ncbi:PDZ domain-containing protein GIPC1 isoform X1 [Tachysurus ichikawai]
MYKVCLRYKWGGVGGGVCRANPYPVWEYAATMVELGKDKKNPDEFAEALDETLGDFAFPDEFVFDVWGAIGDAKVGRI